MSTELVHVGYGNILAINKIVAIVSPRSAPIKRMIQAAEKEGVLIDLTSGRRPKAVIFMDSGHMVLAALAPETIASRMKAGQCTATPITDD